MKNYWIPILMAAAAVVGVAAGWISGRNAAAQEIEDKISSTNFFGQSAGSNSKLQNIIDIINLSYVDRVDVDSIQESVIPDMLKQLDPHSVYIPAKDVAQVTGELKSDFGGIGVQFTIQDDTVNVVSVVSGGPSSALGILPGDKIIKVNGHDFTGKSISNQAVMDSLRGEIGTHVKVSVLRDAQTVLDYDITRGKIPNTSVDVSYRIAEGTGYMKIDRFAEKTYEEMMAGLAKLKNEDCNRIIVDLRSNSGGYLNVVVAMCNEFLEKGDMIVYTEGAHQRRQNTVADGNGMFKDIELVVLIDEYSASASEIFSGAMQDNDRGTVIGRRSFGKGLVQTEMPLRDGSSLRLTVARYHTPSGRCIQKPYSSGNEDYYDDMNERFQHGELFNEDSIKADTTQIFHTRKGRTVYGGGGITPDYFVPVDTSMASKYLYQLRAKRMIYNFALDYANKHRATLKEMSAKDLTSFLLGKSFFSDLNAYASKHGVSAPKTIEPRELNIIENETRAYIGQVSAGNEAFYPILNTMDPAIDKALEVLGVKSEIKVGRQ